MKLKKLLKNLPQTLKVKGSIEVEISGVCSHSQRVAPGNLFIAKKGLTSDGARYIPKAAAAGAAAVLTDMYDPSFSYLTQLIHSDPGSLEGELAAAYYDNPSDKLLMVAITGTNGKTTSAYLTRWLLLGAGLSCGLIGTIEYLINGNSYPATHTTPDACINQKLLREMVNSGCRAAVMEVTSHALDQKRIANIGYDIAIFTNLTAEHLDYHKNIEDYGAAKALLFDRLEESRRSREKYAILNNDSPFSATVAQRYHGRCLTYGIRNPADMTASSISQGLEGLSFNMNYKGVQTPASLPLVGSYNIYNALAATAAAVAGGIPFEKAASLLATAPPIPGRLERIENPLGLNIYVDFAHTPDALENALSCLAALAKGKIITVFGCGGDRDKKKRPLMGAISERYSSLTIITNDNPRSEDPETIAAEIADGLTRNDSAIIELDRRRAIKCAIATANSNDIILIAGKGHEKSQTFAHMTLPFDDCLTARQLCIQNQISYSQINEAL